MQTIWHDSNGRVKAVYDGDTTSTAWDEAGYIKAVNDPEKNGRVSQDHVVTVENGEVVSATYDPIFTEQDLANLRARKAEEIKLYGLSLIQSRIPAISTFEMVDLMKTLWPVLVDPASQPDLAYARDVYVYAIGKLDQLQTATRDQIESYDPTQDPGWP